MAEKASLIHYCRVLLRECRARRHQPDFHARLLSWVARARREAQQLQPPPAQSDLF